MEKKIIIIFIAILVIFGIVYIYKTKLADSSRLEIRSYCHNKAIEEAQKKFKRENPKEKEKIEIGTYIKTDYNVFYNQCLLVEGY